jgi:two-component system, sensor histidine kinase LadS
MRMLPSEDPSPADDVQRQLDLAHAQLLQYANDLKRLLDAERRKAQELAEAHARLQLLDQLKTDFLTFIAHELRTPLSHMNVVDLFDPQGEPQEQAELLDMMRHGYARLHGFIQTGLEYFAWRATARIETPATVDLAEVVRQVAEQTPSLAAPGMDFAITAPSLPCRVRGEERHLATVIQILFDNAVKFSPRECSIRVQLQATGAEVTLTIADRGQGFPPALAWELFQPFTIADVLHHAEGTGLNLALAQAIVTAYGGRLWADSAGVGQGATFVAAFPAVSLTQDTTQG